MLGDDGETPLVLTAKRAGDVRRTASSKRVTAPYTIQSGNRIGKLLFERTATVEGARGKWKAFARSQIDTMVANSEICAGVARTCTCISACYYAAAAAGVPRDENLVDSSTAQRAYNAYLKRVIDEAMAIEARGGPRSAGRRAADVLREVAQERFKKGGEDAHLKKPQDYSLIVSNLTFQIELLDMLGPGVELRIVRDWKLDGYKFRTTWSAGWYLDHLVRSKPALLGKAGTGFSKLL